MEEKKIQDTEFPRGLACLLAYLIPFLGGVFFLLLEKKDRLVRFHAVQSILFWLFFSVYGAIAGLVVRIGFVKSLLQAAFFFLWVFVMYKALDGRMYGLPILGDLARRHVYGPDRMGGRQ